MHHAFPIECAYPALSSSQKALSADEFAEQTGQSATVDEATLKSHRDALDALDEEAALAEDRLKAEIDSIEASEVDAFDDVGAEDFELPWTDDEELFLSCTSPEL